MSSASGIKTRKQLITALEIHVVKDILHNWWGG